MIYFVGAGSGAPDLITVRGAKLLSEADVIVYAGSLVNPALLDYKKQGCEVYDSAKMTLEEVIAVMAPAAQGGQDGCAPAHGRPVRLRRAPRADGRAGQAGACI